MQDYRNLKVLLLARDLKFISMKDYEPLATELSEVRRMLNTFIQKLRAFKENLCPATFTA